MINKETIGLVENGVHLSTFAGLSLLFTPLQCGVFAFVACKPLKVVATISQHVEIAPFSLFFGKAG